MAGPAAVEGALEGGSTAALYGAVLDWLDDLPLSVSWFPVVLAVGVVACDEVPDPIVGVAAGRSSGVGSFPLLAAGAGEPVLTALRVYGRIGDEVAVSISDDVDVGANIACEVFGQGGVDGVEPDTGYAIVAGGGRPSGR